MTTATVTQTPPKGFTWTEGFDQSRQHLNHRPFRLSHSLANHPLFSLDRLIQQARLAHKRPGDLYFDSGDVRIDQKWGQIPISDLSYEDVLSRIEHSRAWLIMKHIECDPDYAAVLDACTRTVLELAPEPLRSQISKPEMLIIVSSPNRITPFHIDGELNFLVQVRGSKTARVFDRDNRTVLTEEEIERFYTIDGVAANFKPDIGPHAQVFELAPGDAIHIPVNAPHWVMNGTEPSVSLSINYELPESVRANIYRAKFVLRKLGFSPNPPGESPLRDAAKSALVSSTYLPARALGKRLKRLLRKPVN